MDTPHNLSIRICLPEDLELLSRVSRETFTKSFGAQNNPADFKNYLDKAFSIHTLKMELEQPQSHFYFVYDDLRLAAYFKLNTGEAQTDLYEEEGMELERIYVLEEFQGLGIGSWVLDQAKSKAEENDKRYLWLGVWEENRDAIRFYEKYGFRKTGMHPYYIGNDRQMDWIMRLDLRNK